MADTRKQEQQADSPQKAVREAVKETEPAGDELAIDRLIADAPRYLGCDSHVAAGAFSGLTRKNLSIEEARAAVKTWLKSPVKSEG